MHEILRRKTTIHAHRVNLVNLGVKKLNRCQNSISLYLEQVKTVSANVWQSCVSGRIIDSSENWRFIFIVKSNKFIFYLQSFQFWPSRKISGNLLSSVLELFFAFFWRNFMTRSFFSSFLRRDRGFRDCRDSLVAVLSNLKHLILSVDRVKHWLKL